MANDQLFKELLQTFLPEFLELFFPAEAEQLDLSRVTFRDKELFTDVAGGSQREADVVAEVFTGSGEPRLLLIHIEIESRRRTTFRRRMWEYYSLFRLRHDRPVFPVVVYSRLRKCRRHCM